jgi:hypothetical protein
LEIDNFQFAIATEAGALLAQSEMSREQTEKEKFCRKCAILADSTAGSGGEIESLIRASPFSEPNWHGQNPLGVLAPLRLCVEFFLPYCVDTA